MALGMIQALPRNVLAKLNGMSTAEEHKVFSGLAVKCYVNGHPHYGVAECRAKLAEVRKEPVATVQSIADGIKIRLSTFEEQFSRNQEENQQTRERVAAVAKAVSNVWDEPTHVTTAQVARMAGWTQARVRKYISKGFFTKSLLPCSRGNGKHNKFDPNKVLDDIASIKERHSRGR